MYAYFYALKYRAYYNDSSFRARVEKSEGVISF